MGDVGEKVKMWSVNVCGPVTDASRVELRPLRISTKLV